MATTVAPTSTPIADRIAQLVAGHAGLTQRVEALRDEGKSDLDIYRHVSKRAGEGPMGDLDAFCTRPTRAELMAVTRY